MLLVAIIARYRALASAIVIVQRNTVLRWHREIVMRKQTHRPVEAQRRNPNVIVVSAPDLRA